MLVASADTSDDPYRFSNRLAPIVSRNLLNVPFDNVSPLLTQTLNSGSNSLKFPSICNIACNNDGTRTIRLTCSRDKIFTSSLTSFPASFAITTTGLPHSNGSSNSHTASTKLGEVFTQQTSPLPNGYFFHIHAQRFTIPLCSPITPLGLLVDPEV